MPLAGPFLAAVRFEGIPVSIVEYSAVMVCIGVLGSVVIALFWSAVRRGDSTGGQFARNRDGSFQAVCAVCHTRSTARAEELAVLSSAEKALVVRERPAALGKNLVEYVCPQCDASHCYSASPKTMRLIGVNLYQGQSFQATCKECQKPLEMPRWALGAYDGRWRDAPGAIDDCGMLCPLCGAISCVACCKTATRNRTSDGTLLCPRCYRGPLEQFYHPPGMHP